MTKKVFEYYVRWSVMHKEWQEILKNGADVPRCTDGHILNGIRNNMKYLVSDMETFEGIRLEEMLEEIETSGVYDVEELCRELPPEMPEKWMREDREEILKKAQEALVLYCTSSEYRYIKECLPALSEEDIKIVNVIRGKTAFLYHLRNAIKYDRPALMRYYSDTDRYMEELRFARELLELHIVKLSPFCETEKE